MDTRIWLPFLVWTLYVASGTYFLFSRNLARKLRWWLPHQIIGAVLFVGVMFAWGFPLIMIAPMAAFIAITTTRRLRRAPPFCLHCGAILWPSGPFAKPTFCSRCGVALQPAAETAASRSNPPS